MKRGQISYPLAYRRARTLLFLLGLFWLWTWLGSASAVAGLFHSPLHALLALYALAVAVLASLLAALLAAVHMVLNRPRYDDVVVALRAPDRGIAQRSRLGVRPAPEWWFTDKAS
jgi:hypothetical protein